VSRTDTTLGDWLDVEESTETDASEEGGPEQPLTGAHWEPQTPQCECGVPLEEWHAPAEARRMVRIYGDQDEGTVPVCPACVDWSNCTHRQHEDTIPHAVKEYDGASSVEARPREELLLREVTR
jgi:hypothetical protein